MKESKDEAIFPYYRDSYGVWHYSDDTHDKVYELNKQMCDIDKHLSEAGYFRMICDGQIETRKKLIDMEEKKTKTMTKAEAFEWLKGKKVLCYSSKMEAVQGFVKSLGFHWFDYSQEPMLVPILFLGEDGRLTYSVSLKRFDEHEYEEISADDILSIEIVEECAKDDEDPYFGGRIKDLQEMIEDDEVLIITKTNFLTMTK